MTESLKEKAKKYLSNAKEIALDLLPFVIPIGFGVGCIAYLANIEKKAYADMLTQLEDTVEKNGAVWGNKDGVFWAYPKEYEEEVNAAINAE